MILAFTVGLPLLIYAMIRQQRLRRRHQMQQAIGAFAFGDIAGGFLVGDIVRRRGCHLFLAVTPNHQMAITDAREKFDTVAAELFSQVLNNLRRFLSRDVTRREVLHGRPIAAATQGNQIAAKGDVFGTERHAHACGFER